MRNVLADTAEIASAPATLGDVLYAAPRSRPVPAESEWRALVHSIAGGDQVALHALYDRAHRPVYTLILRITRSRETADELTVDVFYDVWRRASAYEPANGTVLGWIMNQARSRAIDRLRFEGRKKRSPAEDPAESLSPQAPGGDAALATKQEARSLRVALAALAAGERQAIEAAYFGGLTHHEVARQLDQPLGTVKTRIRAGLHKLRDALDHGGR